MAEIPTNIADLARAHPAAADGSASSTDAADGVELYAKVESQNPGGSVKDRIARSMIEDAERRGRAPPGLDAGGADQREHGIALAGRRGQGLPPDPHDAGDDMSLERRRLLARLGAEIVLTPAIAGMTGAVFAAQALCREHPDYVMLQQFENPANPEAHRRTTALEILEATGGKVDGFVAGVGTGGTITGVGEVLRQRIPGVRIVAVEPAKSPVLSGGKARVHGIQGIGASFVPADPATAS